MRRFSLLVLSTLVLASLPGFPLPTRNAAAALPGPSCAQKRSQCLNNALLNAYQCEIQMLGDCASKYEQAKQTCERNYLICSTFGGL
jgi:hypothetical protein